MMNAVVWNAPERLTLQRVPIPHPLSPTDAIVRVECASTCGTDLHIFRGAVPRFVPGTVIGHEFVGTVSETGAAVSRVSVGQRVWSSDHVACGVCSHCEAGRHPQCPSRMLFGFSGIQPRLDGGMAEFVLVPQADLVLEPLLPGTDPRAALLAADVLPTALSAVDKSGARAGQRMAIVGAGPVGLLSAFLARDAGADVTLFEINSHRIERVTAAGFHVVAVDADGGRPPEDLRHSFDAAIDAVGGQRGLKAALDLARPNGRVIGAGSQASEYAMNWGALFQHEMTIGFVIGNAIGMKSVVNEVLPRCGPILDAIFSDLLPLSSVPEYFHSLYRRERFKALVEVR